MTPVKDLVEDAHEEALRRELPDAAQELQRLLGQKLVAFAVGDKHPKSIGRYARNERTPEDETRKRLVDLLTIVEILRGGMGEGTIKSWMLGTNPRLKGKSPIVAFHEGLAYEVMGAAKAFVIRR